MKNKFEYVVVDGSNRRFGAESIAKGWRKRGFFAKVEQDVMQSNFSTRYVVLVRPKDSGQRLKLIDKGYIK